MKLINPNNHLMGVYVIVNKINNKFYIGSTNNFNKRHWCHRNSLRKNQHHCTTLQNSWNIYLECNFEMQILCGVDEIKDLRKKEQVFLDYFFNDKMCLNINSNADGFGFNEQNPMNDLKIREKVKEYFFKSGFENPMFGKTKKLNPFYNKKHTESTKKLLSKQKSGKNHPCFGKERKIETIIKIWRTKGGKIVQQIDPNTNIVLNEYYGIRQAAKRNACNAQRIYLCCSEGGKIYKNYIWKYKEEK